MASDEKSASGAFTRIAAAHGAGLPRVGIEWKAVDVTATSGCCKKSSTSVLQGVTARASPGRLTLVIGNPGAGKTTLLRTAAQLPLAGGSAITSGSVSFTVEGASKDLEAEISGWPRLAAMSTQFDQHLGLLNVKETLEFAAAWQQPRIGEAPTGLTGEQVAEFLGLDRALHTRLGTETVRGVSGGESRRVSVGEALVGPARVWLLDSFSDGLDAARTKAITTGLLRPFAEKLGGTVVCVLQQPAQELFELFDDVILLRNGHCLYSGPRDGAVPFFTEELGLLRTGGISDPELLANIVSEPHVFDTHRNRAAPGADVELESAAMAAAFVAHARAAAGGGTAAGGSAAAAKDAVASGGPLAADGSLGPLNMGLARKLFASSYARGVCAQAYLLSGREVLNTTRDVQFLLSHFLRALIMALVVGSLYSGLTQDDFVQRIALLFFTALNLAMGGVAELPVALLNKLIVDRQARGLHMYHPWLYAVCVSLVYIPVGVLEVALYSIPTYYIVGFAEGGDRVANFVFLVLGLVIAMISIFRMLAWLSGQLEVAMAAMVPFIALFVLFSGFLATRTNLGWGDLGQGLYWFSPVAWIIRALAVNEFLASEYDGLIEQRGPAGGQIRKGDAYLDAYEIDGDPRWVDWAYAYVYGLAAAFLILGAVIFQLKVRFEPLGTRRLRADQERKAPSAADAVVPVATAKAHGDVETGEGPTDGKASASAAAAGGGDDDDVDGAAQGVHATISSADVTKGKVLAFRDLVFDVRLVGAAAKKAEAKRKQSGEADAVSDDAGAVARGHKRLLNRISGVARPGRVLALCGESGAGKTTLLNTLAGRTVSQGHVKGTIMLGDHVIRASQLRSRVGYVEQFDRHLVTATVREALEFSAWMRRGSEATSAVVARAVDEALDLLELRPVENKRIGDEKTGEGLSRGERKRLTIGVELVANPGVLFLDEPTTALSATQARDVARVIRRVASSGRTVICTLHQPSVGVWSNMDDLLLLARGGYMVYFGEVGAGSATMVRYLSCLPGAHPLPAGMNPADYMLDVIGSEGKTDGAALGKAASMAVDTASAAVGGAPALASAASLTTVSTGGSDGAASGRKRILQDVFSSSEAKAALDATLDGMRIARDTHRQRMGAESASSADHGHVNRLNLFWQFVMLTKRASLDFLRDAEFGIKRVVMFAVLAVIAGGVFFGLATSDTDQAAVASLCGGVVMSIIFVGAIAANTTAVAVQKRRPSYVREQAAHTYSPFAYASAIWLATMPWNAIFIVVFLSIYAAMIGYDFEQLYGIMFLIIFLFATNMGGLAMAIGYTAETPQLVTVLVSLVMSLSAMFGGFFVPRADIPPGWIWMHYIAPMAFPLEAAVPAAFVCPEGEPLVPDAPGPCGTIDAFDNGVLLRDVTKLRFVEGFYGIDHDNQGLAVGLTVVYGAVTFLIFLFGLWRIRATSV